MAQQLAAPGGIPVGAVEVECGLQIDEDISMSARTGRLLDC